MILCIGEAVIDMIRSSVDGVGEAFLPLPGGCAYNTSIAIGRQGMPVVFFGRISSNFFGDIQVNRLKENNVNTDLLIRCEQNPILAFIKVEKGKDPQYAFYEEGTADRMLSPQELPSFLDDITCVVFGSVSMAMEPIGSTIEEFIFNNSSCKVIAFDPNIRPVMIKDKDAYIWRFEKMVAASTIVKISIEDYGYFDISTTQPQTILEKLIGMGTRLAIVTLGDKGSAAMLKRNDASVIKVSAQGERIPKVADTVGAGDTFHGVFLSWLEKRGKMSHNAIANLSETDLHEALTFANKAAAYVCTQHGCEPPIFTE